ncbi:MAG: peptide deformylase [Candidatus Shapirobacteria bacterium]|nr:peptide deformylase [Candidatus Shapirobacteria bacterium]
MERINLIQHGELQKTTLIPGSKINGADLKDLFELSKEICQTNIYCGLAMNQIPLELIKQRSGYQSHCRIIFLRPEIYGGGESSVLEDTLIINPRIKVKNRETYLGFEGCGSVDFDQTLMLVRRPTDFKLSGLFYMSGMGLPKYEEVESKNLEYFNASQHEIDHLNGYTALNFPEKLVNPLEESEFIVDIEQLRQILEDGGGKSLYVYANDRLEKIPYQDIVRR